MKTQNGFIGALVLVLIALAIAGGVYYTMNGDAKCVDSIICATGTLPELKTYKNNHFSFELRYPADVTIEEKSATDASAGDDWVTVTFKHAINPSIVFFVGTRGTGAPGEGYDNPQVKQITVAGKQVEENIYLPQNDSDDGLVTIWTGHSTNRADILYAYFKKSQAQAVITEVEAIAGSIKYTDGAQSGATSVKKMQWVLEQTNPTATEGNEKYEQTISVDVTFNDNGTKRYNLGTDHGCKVMSSPKPLSGGKQVLGELDCYYALSGGSYVAYTLNGKFIVEHNTESARDGSIVTKALLEL